MDKIKLIVGLANPGLEYERTRHNVGAWFIKRLTDKFHTVLQIEPKFFGSVAKINVAQHDVKLLIPNTFMNLSGKSVAAIAKFYRFTPEQILIVHDELALQPGCSKLKFGGSNNGHNGLKDVQNKLGDNPGFFRLRIGIGHPGDKNKVVGFVLGTPTQQELNKINASLDQAITAIITWFEKDIANAMNQLHSLQAE